MKLFKSLREKSEDSLDVDVIERKARIIAKDLEDMIAKYDERTEEILELLREKSKGLWECRQYYDIAMQLKAEAKTMKSEKAEKSQEISQLKRQWGDIAEHLINNDMLKKISTIDNTDDFITYLQLIQFMDKDNIPVKQLNTIMKKINITLEEIEENYIDLYNNLKMKDWS